MLSARLRTDYMDCAQATTPDARAALIPRILVLSSSTMAACIPCAVLGVQVLGVGLRPLPDWTPCRPCGLPLQGRRASVHHCGAFNINQRVQPCAGVGADHGIAELLLHCRRPHALY